MSFFVAIWRGYAGEAPRSYLNEQSRQVGVDPIGGFFIGQVFDYLGK